MSRPTERSDGAPAILKAAWADHRVPLMAALTAKLGDLETAEDALAEAALRAHRSWTAAIPSNPCGWLYRVALNAARDGQRRSARHAGASPALKHHQRTTQLDGLDVSPDARLALFRRCADPSLSSEQRIALMLFHLAGLDCAAIAKAFLVREVAIHQRLSRARKKLKGEKGNDGGTADLSAVRSALEVIYLQSYRNIGGGVEAEALGRDALHLAGALCEAGPDEPESWALLALMHLLEARRPARLTDEGDFVPFDRQDVGDWSAPHLRAGAAAMRRAASRAERAEPYGLRAQVELTRIIARQKGEPCDAALLALHDRLVALTTSPFAAVDRALVLARLDGARAGLDALDGIDADLSGHAGWHLAKAELHTRLGEAPQARLHLKAALTLMEEGAEKAFVATKLDSLPA
ncbi:DUF6596 domain-containing protein [uncultured Algimonas sp.]|uniref:DUF6596 domain-containing protein n=1 Tax=uncultured Algimonas sp. TaxID=1547920 RepID=UPI0026191FD1|nr:DUF6596 domain-containing protein [uncultured Algimonas sp.]